MFKKKLFIYPKFDPYVNDGFAMAWANSETEARVIILHEYQKRQGHLITPDFGEVFIHELGQGLDPSFCYVVEGGG